MGKRAYYGAYPGPNDPHGPHAVWVRDPNSPSDICEKLGMLAGTFHDHLDQEFKRVVEGEVEPEPTPEPDPEPPPVPQPAGWQMIVEKVAAPGLRLLILILPNPGISMQIQSPWGRVDTVVSGTKPEYGPGGAELPLWGDGQYAIRFLDQAFTVQIGMNSCTKARFVESMSLEEPKVRLVSGKVTQSQATNLLANIEATGFVGVFSIE